MILWLLAASAEAFGAVAAEKSEEITAFFKGAKKTVLTFVGYSGAGYEDQASMLQQAERIRGELDPKSTIVNIGATAEGVGAIYEFAKRKGFFTAGIVSVRDSVRGKRLPMPTDFPQRCADGVLARC